MWTDGEVIATARRKLQEGLDRFHDEGIIADGEIGDANPVYAVSTVIRREGPGAFTGIVLSTLPPGPSRWLHLDVPSRMRRETRNAGNPPRGRSGGRPLTQNGRKTA